LEFAAVRVAKAFKLLFMFHYPVQMQLMSFSNSCY